MRLLGVSRVEAECVDERQTSHTAKSTSQSISTCTRAATCTAANAPHIFINAQIDNSICIRVQTCIHNEGDMQLYIHGCSIRAHIHVYIHIHICTDISIYKYVYNFSHIYIYK